jgi:hypothetical protein
VPVLVLAAFLPKIGLGQPASSLGSVNQTSATMNTFVIIFRQGPRTLTDIDKQRRAEKTTVWARGQNEAGHKLEPRILAPEGAHRGQERDAAAAGNAWPITALLFLEANDLAEAAQIAETR